MISENKCACGSGGDFGNISEAGLLLGNRKVQQIPLPLCPYCSGFANGVLKVRCSTFSGKFQNKIKALASSYLPPSVTDNDLYKAGVADGEEKGWAVKAAKNLFILPESQGLFTVGEIEFGETYHTAGAMLCSREILAQIKDASTQQVIFLASIFDRSRLRSEHSEVPLAKGKSTDILCEWFRKASDQDKIFSQLFQSLMHNFFTSKAQADNLINQCQSYLCSRGLTDKSSSKAIVWLRNKDEQLTRHRNLSTTALKQLIIEIEHANISHVILMGDPPTREQEALLLTKNNLTTYNMTDLYKHPGFQVLVSNYQIAGQLLFVKVLQKHFNVKFAIGMMSGAMDGPAFIGLPTIILTDESPVDRIPRAGEMIKTMICVNYDKEIYNGKRLLSCTKFIESAIAKITPPPKIGKLRRYISEGIDSASHEHNIFTWLILTIVLTVLNLLASKTDTSTEEKTSQESGDELNDRISGTYSQTFSEAKLFCSEEIFDESAGSSCDVHTSEQTRQSSQVSPLNKPDDLVGEDISTEPEESKRYFI